MTRANARAAWATQRERGALPLVRLMVWIILRAGRPAARIAAWPVCAYFFLFAPEARAASRAYLARALGGPPTVADRWRLYWCFATCLLDRVLLLNGRADLFDIELRGEETIAALHAEGAGAFLFGAHVGSFEAARAAGRRVGDIRTSLVMYEENARKTNAVLHAVNPALALGIIGLGRPGSMLAVRERLQDGHLVGVLADRSLDGERCVRIPFLGAPACFPVGPFRMAVLLRRPVVLMLGLYRGGGRYEIVFEPLAALDDGEPVEPVEVMMRRYVARLEHHCRRSPYNWFNFFDFWA